MESNSPLDLTREQQASLTRHRYPYSLAARFFFGFMDLVAGRKMTLAKAKLLEILASIPYREWEIRHYGLLTRHYRRLSLVEELRREVQWEREAQDNEYWHLLVIEEKMKEEGLSNPWYLTPPIPWLMTWAYALMEWLLARINIRRAFLFNAEFEDHAEHEYAQLVAEHPEWETQVVNNPLVAQYSKVHTWADVFRRISLDERDHRNRSFAYSGKEEHIVRYEGMPQANA